MLIRHLAVAVLLSCSAAKAQDAEPGQRETALIPLLYWELEDDVGFLDHRFGLPTGYEGFGEGYHPGWMFATLEEEQRPLPRPPLLRTWVLRRLFSLGLGEPLIHPFHALRGWRVEGTPAQIAEVRRSVNAIHAAFVRPIHYRFTLVEGSSLKLPADRTDLSQDEREACMESGRTVFDLEIQRRHGARAYAGEARSRTFIRDYEVEIDFGGAFTDPRVDVLFEGPRLCVVGHRTADDDLLLLDADLIFGRTDPQLAQLDLETPLIKKLDHPILRETRVQTSFVLRKGRTAVLSVEGASEHGPSFALLIDASLSMPDPARALPDVDTRSIRAFVKPGDPPPWSSLDTPDAYMQGEDRDSDPSPWTETAEDLAEESLLSSYAHFLVALDRRDRDTLDELFGSLDSRDGQTLSIDVRDIETTTRMRVPVRSGAQVVLRRSWGTYEIHDYEVEIAPAGTAANPWARPAFDGVGLSAWIDTDKDRNRVTLEGSMKRLGPLLERGLKGEHLGRRFHFDAEEAPIDLTRTLDWGQETLIPLGPDREARVSLHGGNR